MIDLNVYNRLAPLECKVESIRKWIDAHDAAQVPDTYGGGSCPHTVMNVSNPPSCALCGKVFGVATCQTITRQPVVYQCGPDANAEKEYNLDTMRQQRDKALADLSAQQREYACLERSCVSWMEAKKRATDDFEEARAEVAKLRGLLKEAHGNFAIVDDDDWKIMASIDAALAEWDAK
jgi:hypothetical protein